MRHSILSLLLLVACVVSTSWAACNDGNSNFGDGCYNNEVESGYNCPSSGTCSLSDYGNTRTNTAQNLVFQTNFNNGIFDISSNHMAFKANTGVTCSRDNTDATHQSYCTFTGTGVGITGATTPASFPTGANPRTVCAWIRTKDTSLGSQVFFAYGTPSLPNGFQVGRSQNRIFLSGFTNSATNQAGTIPVNTWTHVCAAYTGSTTASFWQNGAAGTQGATLSANQALNTLVSQSTNMYVGRNIGTSTDFDFVGDLFDVRLYSVALDTTAVAAIYNEGLNNKALVSLTDCGNGLLEAGEVCDDGNTVSGDGCSNVCAIEASYVCTGAPSQCATPSLAKEYAVASSGDASIVTSDNSQVSTAASTVDDSRLTWKPNVQSYRVGEFTYTVPGLYPYATYTVDFIFAETVKTAAKQRVFDVKVQGSTPQWSPIDVFASAGKSNTAIMKSITTAADNLGNLAIEFSNNGIVQAIRVTRRVHAVASLAAGGLTVSGSTTSSLFNPLKGYPDFSMEVYINTDTIATSSIISKGNSFSLQLTSTGTFVCVAGGSTVNGAITISASSWYHIACVVDSKAGKASLYINGVLDVSENVVPTWPASSAALVFGSNFVGYLDSPRLWQRALTHNELLAHAVSSASVPLSYGLIEEWSFDSLTTFSAGAIGTNGGAANAAKFLTVDENTFETAEASPVVQISCGGSGSGLVIADSYFVGGAPVSTSDNLVAPAGSDVADSLLQTARTGDFEYVVSGFPPRQSYTVGIVLVSYEGTASMNGYIQGVQVLSAESVSEGSPEYDEFTVLADYSGVISIKFTSATVSAIVFTPVLAPAGSLAFFVANAAPGLSYQSFAASATRLSYTNLAASNTDLTAPSTDLPYATALSTTANTGFGQTISGLIPNAYYRVRFHLAELDSTKTTSSRSVNVYAQNTLVSGPIDIYSSAGGTAKPYTTFGIAKANNAGSIVAEVKGCSGGCILSAVEVQPGPVIYKAAATLPLNAQKITIYGADLLPFNGNLGIELVQGTEAPVNCDNLFVLPDRLVCVFSTALVTGALNVKLYTINPSAVEIKNVVVGTVIDALSVEASTAVLATNTARLVLDGAGFGDDSTVTLNTNIACAVISVSEDVIICKPASTLPLGVVRATVTSYGQTSTSVQVGTAVSPPQVASVPSVTASSSTMVINGKGFIASPNHNQNSVTLKQNTNSRKRTLSSSAPSCTIISATTTSITCALSNVVAGPLSVIVIVAGGSSSTFTVNVLPTQTSSCSPRGAKDAYDNTLCNCWSGYAPSDSLYSDCNVAPLCMPEEVTATSTGSAMSAPVTAFVQDKLTVYQSSPIVKHRRETTIRFSYPTGLTSWAPASAVPGAVGAQTCGYPGNLWQKSIDAVECRDVYKAQIPWTGHTACGFVEDKSVNNDTYSFYKAQMDTTYVTAYPTGSGYMHRITTDSYLVTVSFRKALTFGVSFVTEFIESSTEGFVSVNVDSSDYDPNSRTMYVTITAETRWPYLLNLSQINAGTFSSDIGSPASSIIASFTGSELNEQSADAYYACSTDAESTCVQLFLATFKITNTTLCDIAGTYSFSGVQLLCRDVALGQACPNHPVTNVQFKVGSTNLCEDAAIDPSSSLIPDLKAYHEPSMSNAPQIEFYDNDFAYMQFGLESDYASIDAVYFSYIAVGLNPDNGNRDVIYDITQDPAVRLDVGLQRQEVNSLVLAGNAINANFSFQLSVTKLVNTVAQLAVSSPGVPSQLLITASVDVIFHGNNRKRTIDFGGVASASKSAAHPITFHHVERSSVAKHNVEKSETTEEVPSVGETNIWADLDSPDVQTDLDSWFSGLESSGDKLTMTSFLVAACFLLLVIIA